MRFGEQGLRVASLHARLVGRGTLHPERAANEIATMMFGADTAHAVRTFQAQQSLSISGWVNEATWSALHCTEEEKEVPRPRPAPAFAEADLFGAEILRLADADAARGVAEETPGRRRGPRIDNYLTADPAVERAYLEHRRLPDGSFQGAPYSALAALCWVREAARDLGVPCPVEDWGDLSTAPRWADAAFFAQALQAGPRPGRLGLIGLEGCLLHVCVIARVEGDHVETREADSSHRVLGRRRPLSQMIGYVALGEVRPTSASQQLTICLLCNQVIVLCKFPDTCPHRRKIVKEDRSDRATEF